MTRALAMLLLAAAVVGSRTAESATITFDFTVRVQDVFGVAGVSVGDTVVGSYTFESSLTDLNPELPETGTYAATGGFQFTAGTFAFNSPNFLIGLGNNVTFPSGIQDYYTVQGFLPGEVTQIFNLFLASFENLSAITADALPATPPNLSLFEYNSFGYCFGQSSPVDCTQHGILGVVTSLTVRALPVAIDIKPGSFPNSINLGAAGVVPVAILSSATFDATQVDPATVSLAGAGVKMIGKSDRRACSIEDVNGDALLDLLCRVTTAQFMIEPGDSVAVLEAQTFSGQRIRGQDSIRIVSGD